MHDDDLRDHLRSLDQSADATEPDAEFRDALFLRLDAQRTGGESGLSRFVPAVVAAAVIGGAIGLGAAVGSGLIALPTLVGEGPSSPTPSASLEASDSATPSPLPTQSSEPTPTTSPTPSPSVVTPSESPASVTFAIDTLVVTIVEGLSVRADPGRDAEALGTLPTDARSFIVAGPEAADGYDWYQVSALGLPPNSGCATPIETDPWNCPDWIGWVAAAAPNGDPWLQAVTPNCPPDEATFDQLTLEMPPVQRLACYGDRQVTFRAWWPTIRDEGSFIPCPDTGELSWLSCTAKSYGGPESTYVSPSVEEGHRRLVIGVDPDGVAMPARGSWVEITARHDHPDAELCRDSTPADPATGQEQAAAILGCRTVLVVEEVTTVGGP